MYFLQEGQGITIPMFRFLILVYICAGFQLKCPEPAQWSRRAVANCPDPSKYFCLKNDLINGYSENCTVSDFQQPGRKGVLRGGMDAEICSSQRYQPWPLSFFTNASTHCIFLKSKCNEEGQVIHGNGNRNNDITCRCDYSYKYDFLIKPRNPCFCVPSEEDCSCYLKTCLNPTDTLSPDYECIHEKMNLSVSHCTPIFRKRVSKTGNHSHTKDISRKENISNQARSKFSIGIILAAICMGFFLVFCINRLIENCCNKDSPVISCTTANSSEDKSTNVGKTTAGGPTSNSCKVSFQTINQDTQCKLSAVLNQSVDMRNYSLKDVTKSVEVANTIDRTSDLPINGSPVFSYTSAYFSKDKSTNVGRTTAGDQTSISCKVRHDTLCKTSAEIHQSIEMKNSGLSDVTKSQEGVIARESSSDLLIKENNSQKECKYCQSIAFYWCYECKYFRCENCYIIHQTKDRYYSHSCQPISDSFKLNCKFDLNARNNLEVQDLNCLPNGLLVVATDKKGEELMTCSIKGRNIQFIPINKKVHKIAVIDKNNVAVLLAQEGTATVVLVDIQNKTTGETFGNQKCNWHNRSPFIYVQNHIYIGSIGTIFKMDRSGCILEQIPLCPRSTPLDACYNFDSLSIYYINEQKGRVLRIDTHGNKTPLFSDPKFKHPKSLTIDGKGTVFVLCKKETCIVNDINYIYSVIKVDLEGESEESVITNIKIPFYCIPLICFNHSQNILVLRIEGTVYVYSEEQPFE